MRFIPKTAILLRALPSFLLTVIFASVLPSARGQTDQTMYISGHGTDIYQVDATGANNTGTATLYASLPGAYPYGLAFDSSGNLWVADQAGSQISEVTTSGSINTLATGYESHGLVFDSAGDLFVSGGTNSKQLTEYAPPSGSSPLETTDTWNIQSSHEIEGLAFDSGGALYSADTAGDIDKINPAGGYTLFADIPGLSIYGIVFGGGGYLYASVSGGSTDEIERISSNGTPSLFTALPAGSDPTGLAFDDGNLYVVETGSNQVVEISSDGSTVTPFVTGLDQPHDIAFAATPVPEPSTWAVLAAGAGSLLLLRRRRQSRG